MSGVMNTSSRRKWVSVISVAGIGLGLGAGLWWLSRREPPKRNALQISFVGKPTKVDPFNRLPFFENPVAFHLMSSKDCSIAVWETGIQIRTPAGWKALHEEHRNEPWRLKAGVPLQFTVEPPHAEKWSYLPEQERSETWRAYIRYGTEMKGPQLWKWQLRGVWQDLSFSNWTGKAWGGGRFSGRNELFSEEIRE